MSLSLLCRVDDKLDTVRWWRRRNKVSSVAGGTVTCALSHGIQGQTNIHDFATTVGCEAQSRGIASKIEIPRIFEYFNWDGQYITHFLSARDVFASLSWRLKDENLSLMALYAPKDMPAAGATLNSVGTQPLNRPLNPSFFQVLTRTCMALSYLQMQLVRQASIHQRRQ